MGLPKRKRVSPGMKPSPANVSVFVLVWYIFSSGLGCTLIPCPVMSAWISAIVTPCNCPAACHYVFVFGRNEKNMTLSTSQYAFLSCTFLWSHTRGICVLYWLQWYGCIWSKFLGSGCGKAHFSPKCDEVRINEHHILHHGGHKSIYCWVLLSFQPQWNNLQKSVTTTRSTTLAVMILCLASSLPSSSTQEMKNKDMENNPADQNKTNKRGSVTIIHNRYHDLLYNPLCASSHPHKWKKYYTHKDEIEIENRTIKWSSWIISDSTPGTANEVGIVGAGRKCVLDLYIHPFIQSLSHHNWSPR